MKPIAYVVGGIAGLIGLFVVTMFAASELGGEVVTLQRKAADGSVSRVRVWIVESESGVWIEHGAPQADWIAHLNEEPIIKLERDGAVRDYLARPDPDSHALYHTLRSEKYGLADQLVALLISNENCEGIPVRIDPT